MLIDSHNHSNNSVDGNFSVDEMLKAAVKKNIDVFTITDHCDVDEFEKNNLAVTINKSVVDISEAKKTSPIKLLTGIELGQPLLNLEKAEYILNKYSFDFVLGSIHAIKSGEDFYWTDYAKMSDSQIDEILARYYQEVYDLAVWNNFDSLAHITYPYRYIINAKAKRNIKYNADKYDDIAEKAFKLIIKNKKAIECNSSSMRNSKESYNLNYKYMKMFHDLGGEYITVGSDAHTTDMVGNSLQESLAMLNEIGFKYITYFENRKPVQVKLQTPNKF